MGYLADLVESMPHCLVGVRHGETAFNEQNRMATHTDVDLTARGVEQAETVARALAGVTFDRAFCSPLTRARRTGEIALRDAAVLSSDGLTDDARLIEPHAGPFEGRTFDELSGRDDFRAYTDEDDPVVPEGAEPVAATAKRARAFLADCENTPGRTFAASHGALLRVLACVASGGRAGAFRRLKIDNCHLIIVRFHPRPPAQVCAVNLPPI